MDDSRVGTHPAVLKTIYEALYAEFKVTVADGSRHLGIDVDYNKAEGVLTIHMETYVRETVTRFESCATTAGFPFREIVGCLLCAVGCCHGIRTHLTRYYISLGDTVLEFCITEAMVADLFTKVVTAAQETGLLHRFYNDCVL